jgi:hypothetical protein
MRIRIWKCKDQPPPEKIKMAEKFEETDIRATDPDVKDFVFELIKATESDNIRWDRGSTDYYFTAKVSDVKIFVGIFNINVDGLDLYIDSGCMAILKNAIKKWMHEDQMASLSFLRSELKRITK